MGERRWYLVQYTGLNCVNCLSVLKVGVSSAPYILGQFWGTRSVELCPRHKMQSLVSPVPGLAT